MSVAQGQSIFVPYVCAVYTCKCGRRSIRQGRRSGLLPRGWETRAGGHHACDVCCGKTPRTAT